MTENISQTDSNLIVLTEAVDFQTHALKAVQNGRRNISILSEVLDEAVYDSEAFCDAVRDLVIEDRYSQARILVKDIKPMIEHGHRLLQLVYRLPGKVEIRKLTIEPPNKEEAYLLVGNASVLYKHDDTAYKGYINYNDSPKYKQHQEAFTTLWEKYSVLDPNLRFQLI